MQLGVCIQEASSQQETGRHISKSTVLAVTQPWDIVSFWQPAVILLLLPLLLSDTNSPHPTGLSSCTGVPCVWLLTSKVTVATAGGPAMHLVAKLTLLLRACLEFTGLNPPPPPPQALLTPALTGLCTHHKLLFALPKPGSQLQETLLKLEGRGGCAAVLPPPHPPLSTTDRGTCLCKTSIFPM